MTKYISHPMTRTLVILGLIVLLATIAIFYGKGYRISKDDTGRNVIAGTGILVMTSTPDGARAYIDGELATATDNTINLQPGQYEIRIEKDGYFPWEKTVEVVNQRVTETNAFLFPKAPQLTSLTITGVSNPVAGRNGHIIAYNVASASSEMNGIYIMSFNRGILPFGDARRQIASNLIDNFSESTLEISPDGLQILATIGGETASSRTYLLRTTEFNPAPLLVTTTTDRIREEWALQQERLMNESMRSLNRNTRNLAETYFSNPIFSPDEDKVLYIASTSAELPRVINPPIPSTNSTPEDRNIVEGNMYVYNIKDDKNYLFKEETENDFPEFVWHPRGRHLYFIEENRIYSIEYDGHNQTAIYAGPFLDNFIAPWNDGSGIIILTSFNDPSVPPNLYRLIFK